MIKTGLMAHRSRQKYAKTVTDSIDVDFVSWDEGDLGLVQAHIQAWEMMADIVEEGDYGIILQDDVILTSDFKGKMSYHILNCIEKYGRIGFHAYLRNTRNRAVLRKVDKCRREKKDHVVLPNVYSGNSIALPSEHIKPMLEHFKTMSVPSGDKRINDYLHKQNLPVYFPCPSLVEHRELDSLHYGNVSRHEYRKSIWFES